MSYSVDGGVALVRFERPEQRNAWNAVMQAEYRASMGRAERDPSVRVVVVTGAGSSFCVGGDMQSLQALGASGSFTEIPSNPLDDALFGTDLGEFAFTQKMSKPVLAAMNGSAAGVGLILACYCDFRFAVQGSKLTAAMSRLGLPAEQGLSWIMPRIVGVAHSFDLLVASRIITAEEAEAIGLVNRVLPADSLLGESLAFARTLAQEISPASMRMMKRQIYADLAQDLPTAIGIAKEHAASALKSDDYREGVAAFVGRRPPHFGTGAS